MKKKDFVKSKKNDFKFKEVKQLLSQLCVDQRQSIKKSNGIEIAEMNALEDDTENDEDSDGLFDLNLTPSE